MTCVLLASAGTIGAAAQTRVDWRTQTKGPDIEGHLNETAHPHTAAGIAATARQGDGSKFQMAGEQARSGGVVVYDLAGNVVASDCSVANGTLSCGDGNRISTIILPELGTNGGSQFIIHGAPEQEADGCIVLAGQPGSGQVLRATPETILDDDGYTCAVMEWAEGLSITDLLQIPTRRYIDLQGIPLSFAPEAHAESHRHGGSDEVGTAEAGPNAVPKAGPTGVLAPGWLPGPGPATKGGVQARNCGASNELVQSINEDGTVTCAPAAAGDGGGVGSVGLSMPAGFTVTGSPVTSSGTIAVSANAQPANTVLAGPSSGGAATPAYRPLAPADLPPATAHTFAQYANVGVTLSNSVVVFGHSLPYPVRASKIVFHVNTADASGTYSVGLYGPCAANMAGCPRVAHTAPAVYDTTGPKDVAFVEGTVNLAPGRYYLAYSGSAANLRLDRGAYTTSFASSGSVGLWAEDLPATITTPGDSWLMWTTGIAAAIH